MPSKQKHTFPDCCGKPKKEKVSSFAGGLFPIQTDTPFHLEAIHRFQELALAYPLTAYDAAYLELALRKRLAIATFDPRLTQAAQKAGLGTIPN